MEKKTWTPEEFFGLGTSANEADSTTRTQEGSRKRSRGEALSLVRRFETAEGIQLSKAERLTMVEDLRNGASFELDESKTPSHFRSDSRGGGAGSTGDDAVEEEAPAEKKSWTPQEFFGMGSAVLPEEVSDDTDSMGQKLADTELKIGKGILRGADALSDALLRVNPRTRIMIEAQESQGRLPEDVLRVKDHERGIAAQEKYESAPSGFFANLENPMVLFAEESLPRNAMEAFYQLPAREQLNFERARAVIQQDNIIANPHNFPDVSVQAALRAKSERMAKQDPTVREQWGALQDAYKKDPRQFGAMLFNALMADPYMVAVPLGLGTTPIKATRIALGVAEASTKAGQMAIRVGDRMIDAATLSAGLNLMIEGTIQARAGKEDEAALQMAGGLGAIFGGMFGPFFRGGKTAKDITPGLRGEIDNAVNKVINGQADKVLEAMEPDKLASMSREERAAFISDTQKKIREALGIRSDAEAKAWTAKRKKDVAAAFKNNEEYADYLASLDAERQGKIAPGSDAKKAAEAAKAQAAAAKAPRTGIDDAAAGSTVPAEPPMGARGDALLEAIDTPAFMRSAEQVSLVNRAAKEAGEAVVATADETPSTIPKGQQGKADPKTLARTAAVAGGAALGYGIADDDNKAGGTFLGALTGLTVPAGGTVLGRLKQSGVVAADGSLNILKPAFEAIEKRAVAAAKAGDVKGFETLYKEYQPRLVRQMARFLRDSQHRTAQSAEDIVQEAMVKAWQNIDSFEGSNGASFGTWVYALAKNAAIDSIRKGRRSPNTETMFITRAGDEAPDQALAGSGGAAVRPDVEAKASTTITPEELLEIGQAELKMREAVSRLSETAQQVVTMRLVDGLSGAETAAKLGLTESNVAAILSRSKASMAESIKTSWGAKPVPRGQRGGAVPVISSVKKPNQLTGYRAQTKGTYEGVGAGNSEGNGIYISHSEDMATRFVDPDRHSVKPVYYDPPQKPLHVSDSPLMAQEEIFDPISPDDSYWLRINKEAMAEAEAEASFSDADFAKNPGKVTGDIYKKAGDILTNKLLKDGYDAVVMDRSGGEGWTVLLKDTSKGIVPFGQKGAANPEMLKPIGLIAGGAVAGTLIGQALRDDKKRDPFALEKDAFSGALAATVLALGGGRALGRGFDYTLAPISTRLANIAKPVVARAWKQTQREFVRTHELLEQVDPFITSLNGLAPDIKNALTRAMMTGDGRAVDAALKVINNPKLTAQFREMQKALQKIEQQMVDMGIIKEALPNYFPRSVKDLEGLKNALDSQTKDYITRALEKAERAHKAKTGEELPDRMKDLLVNKILQGFDENGNRIPGYAKGRRVQEITPELLQFYHEPEAALHSYIRAAVKDIEKRKFFGRDLVTNKDKGINYVNLDDSIGAIVRRLRDEKGLTAEQGVQVAKMLKDRFGPGERAMSKGLQDAKSLVNAMLLGNVLSAATQIADTVLQAFHQGPVATVKALYAMGRGKGELNVQKMGLADYIATEFINTGTADRIARFSYKWGVFRGVDHFGKNFAMNAGLAKLRGWVKSKKGIAKLQDLYGEHFTPDEFKQIVDDLRSGNRTDLTDTLAIAELSETQPISLWELPQAYHKLKDGRVLYHLQTFPIKVLDLVRRKAWENIMTGEPKKIAKGFKNLAKYGFALGASNMGTDKLKDWIVGREVEFDPMEIPGNFLETVGFSMYDYKQMKRGGDNPLTIIAESKIPPIISVTGDLLFDPKLDRDIISKVPIGGRFVYQRYLQERKEDKPQTAADRRRARQAERRKRRENR